MNLYAGLCWDKTGPDAAIPACQMPEDTDLPPPSVVPAFLSTTLPGTFGYFSSGWPVAYLIATVIFGIGALVGSLVHVSQPEQVASQSASGPTPLSPLPSVVGRITGMVDCKWETTGLGIRDWGLEKGSKSRFKVRKIPNP